MSERLERRVEELGRKIALDLSPPEAAIARVHRTRRRRRTVRAVALAAVALLVVASAGAIAASLSGESAVAAHKEERSSELRLADGTIAAPIGPESAVELVEESAALARVRLVRGRARFDVRPQAQGRTFRVAAGAVEITVVGTRFVVEYSDEAVVVTVEEGLVRVRAPAGESELGAGQRGVYDVRVPSDPPAPVEAAENPPAPEAGPDWRALASRGDFDRAYEALEGANVRNRVDDLMLAADVSRLSGHPADAVRYLERVIDEHRGDPRAPLASFTLGRVLLGQLGQPQRAARAFELTRTLAPRGELAEDALAREVEAWSRAGATDRARSLAERYFARYPNGRRSRAVREFGGIAD
jgi:transmembrane sensor